MTTTTTYHTTVLPATGGNDDLETVCAQDLLWFDAVYCERPLPHVAIAQRQQQQRIVEYDILDDEVVLPTRRRTSCKAASPRADIARVMLRYRPSTPYAFHAPPPEEEDADE